MLDSIFHMTFKMLKNNIQVFKGPDVSILYVTS